MRTKNMSSLFLPSEIVSFDLRWPQAASEISNYFKSGIWNMSQKTAINTFFGENTYSGLPNKRTGTLINFRIVVLIKIQFLMSRVIGKWKDFWLCIYQMTFL